MGWITKRAGGKGLFSRETWHRRWATLEAKRLVWAESPEALPKGEVWVLDTLVQEDPPEVKKGHFGIAVRHSERTLIARYESEQEHREWLAALRSVAQGRPSFLPAATPSVRGGPAASDQRKVGGPTKQKLAGDNIDNTWWQDKLPWVTSAQAGLLEKMGGSKGGSKSWRQRYAVLQGGELLYFKDNELKGIVPVRGARIETAPPELTGSRRKSSFAIRHPKRTFFASADSEATLVQWVEALRRCATSTDPFNPVDGSNLALDSDEEVEVPEVDHAQLSRVAAPPKRKPRSRVPGAAATRSAKLLEEGFGA